MRVVELRPAPNYALTADESDQQQLTDGKLHRYPIWTKKGSVGWVARTPVKIALKLRCEGESETRFTGKLRLYTASGTPANGVKLPRRIDAYSREKPGHYRHVGSARFDQSSVAGKRNQWISVDVSDAGPDIFLVIHADGKFVMLDEIEWQPSGGAALPARQAEADTVQDVVEDSTKRFKGYLLSRTAPPPNLAGLLRNQTDDNGVRAWFQDPWTGLDVWPARESLERTPLKLDVVGVDQEYESAALGLLNTGADRAVRVQVSATPTVRKAIRLRNVERVLAADGSLVYDPLRPMPEGRLMLRRGEAAYIMITMDLRKLGAGNHTFELRVEDEAGTLLAMLPAKVRVVAVSPWSLDTPRAVNWAYLSDLPVWANRQAALNDLLLHGINVFVIPPAAVPRPALDGTWDQGRMQRLAEQVAFFRGHGELLLFSGWPAWYKPLAPGSSVEQKRAVQQWARRLSREMAALGLENREWALYPVDEPTGERLSLLKQVASWIKGADSAIRIYANPIKRDTTIADLRWLDRYIDIWQPAFDFASGRSYPFFSALEKDWWVYGGLGPPPAKRRPPREYRSLAWGAWAMGAKGIGFWSYSDTAGSSAWDDFDGIRPDWAVVYEDPDGPVSSRRWEAFREGVEDFRLLEHAVSDVSGYCKMSGRDLRAEMKRLAEAKIAGKSEFSRIRRSILEPGCKAR